VYWSLCVLPFVSAICFAPAAFPATESHALDADGYVEVVLRSHPSAQVSQGLTAAAQAERKAVRLLPDPVFGYSWDHAQLNEGAGVRGTETKYELLQTIPWPGTFRAGIRAGDRASDGLVAGAEAVRWEIAAEARAAFARLEASRSFLEVSKAAEEDARSLRDLVTRRVELGESRESDRIKAVVEWLREQRTLAAAERQAETAEWVARALAVEELPRPLTLKPTEHLPLPPLDRMALLAKLVETNPGLRGARAAAERQAALSSLARSSRAPDVGVSVFRDNELDKAASGFSLGLRIPLWNANRGEVARAESLGRVAAAEAERLRIALAIELESRLEELQIAAAQSALLDSEILRSATRSVDLARFSFEEGETSLLDLLDAQRTFRDIQREVVAAHQAVSLSTAEVQRLLGPDFNPWR
jgi:outer membrane protein, heavy metal efflux system